MTEAREMRDATEEAHAMMAAFGVEMKKYLEETYSVNVGVEMYVVGLSHRGAPESCEAAIIVRGATGRGSVVPMFEMLARAAAESVAQERKLAHALGEEYEQ